MKDTHIIKKDGIVLECVAGVEKGPYHYKGCGLPNVILLGGYSVEDFEGELHFSIEDLYGLHKTIGRVIVTTASSLSPDEIRFLRNEMNLTQYELGCLMGVSSQAVARYEKGITGIGGPAERLLRMFYLDHLEENIDVVDFAEYLTQLDDTVSENIALEFDGEWSFKEAACG